jgi:hypothetical protein
MPHISPIPFLRTGTKSQIKIGSRFFQGWELFRLIFPTLGKIILRSGAERLLATPER